MSEGVIMSESGKNKNKTTKRALIENIGKGDIQILDSMIDVSPTSTIEDSTKYLNFLLSPSEEKLRQRDYEIEKLKSEQKKRTILVLKSRDIAEVNLKVAEKLATDHPNRIRILRIIDVIEKEAQESKKTKNQKNITL